MESPKYDRIGRCGNDERHAILTIINAAAEAYRGAIPADCWHDPYMSPEEIDEEIAAGVEFWGYRKDTVLLGVMGIQAVRDVDLIRHAYVVPGGQRKGIGAALISHLRQLSARRKLVGTWTAATWAIGFYQKHGFHLLPVEQATSLLRSYWAINDRQVETSVVLADPPFGGM